MGPFLLQIFYILIFAVTLLALIAIAGLVAHNKISQRNKDVRHSTLYPVHSHVLLVNVRQ